MSPALPVVLAAALLTGGPGPHSLGLSVATDTLPGTSATRYAVPAAAPVVVRYTLVNSGEAGILNLHVDDPEVPSSAITCAGGTALLPPLTTRQCTATVPAAVGRRVRSISASGTLAWFGTQVAATASTGYVGYQASLTVRESVAGADTDSTKPDTSAVGAPVQISYQITNTGDVPLSGLTVRSSLGGDSCSPGRQLAPGARTVCTLAPRAAGGLHLDQVVASATPQLSVLTGDGGVTAAPPVSASDQGAYLGIASGVAAAAETGGASGRGGRSSTPPGLRAATAPTPARGDGGSAADGSSSSKAASASSAPRPGLPRAGAGFSGPVKHLRRSLPWMAVIFLVVLVPLVLRVARAHRSGGR